MSWPAAWRAAEGLSASMRSMTASAWVRSSLPLRKARWVNSPGRAGRAPAAYRASRAVALELGGLLPGVAVGGAADEGQAGVDGAAVPVQDGAVEELPVRGLVQGHLPPGAEGLAGGPDGPGAGEAENPHPPRTRGGGDGGDELGHGGTSSPKGKSLANPPANFPLTGIFDDQNGESGLCTACGKVCGQCVKPLNSFPFHRKGRCTQEQIFLQKAPKWPWSERTKEKSTCKNDESVTKG